MAKTKKFNKKNNQKKPSDAIELRNKALIFDPPPVLIVPEKTKNKVQGEITKKEYESSLKEIDLMVDPNIKALGTIKRKVPVLRNPTPEDWFKWIIEFEEICESKPIPDPRRKALAAPQFLADQAKEIWQKYYRETVVAVGQKYPVPENETAAAKHERELKISKEILEMTLLKCTREFCRVEDPARVQVEYLQNCNHMHGLKIREFANRLKQINDYLPLFPPYELDRMPVQKLRDSELISIIIRAKPISMSIAISKANINIRKMTYEEVVTYLERLEFISDAQKQLSGKSSDVYVSGQKRKQSDDVPRNNPNSSKNLNKRTKYVVCTICKKPGHESNKCWFNKEKNNKPPNRNTNNPSKVSLSTERTYTYEEARQLFANLPSHQTNAVTPHKKRRIVYETSESSEDGEVEHDMNYFRKNNK